MLLLLFLLLVELEKIVCRPELGLGQYVRV